MAGVQRPRGGEHANYNCDALTIQLPACLVFVVIARSLVKSHLAHTITESIGKEQELQPNPLQL